jgi:hypothetical protein
VNTTLPRAFTIEDEFRRSWLAVQTDPCTIEMFRTDGIGEVCMVMDNDGFMTKVIPRMHQSQVRWVNGGLVYSQGGLPHEALREIFEGWRFTLRETS